ncbi:hypothetical protein [Aliarcobacter skirrowii]|uniref:hypothetical protein n=1 Tax=Aliarcobacter skirrowii TaxID=28200 RepID=UPI00082C0029|nr:hypothetical protein [Aliarcobacter skirrowii]
MQTTVHQGNNGRAGGRDYIENISNIYILENKILSKKVDRVEQQFKARKLPTLCSFNIYIKNLLSILISLFFIFSIFNVNDILLFNTIVTISALFIFTYYSSKLIVVVNNEFIKVEDKIFKFSEVRKIKFCRKIIDSYVAIYLKDSFYPDVKIYIINEEQMDLIEEFYRYHLEKIEDNEKDTNKNKV